MTHLFDLPLELLREILGWAVAVRGTKRGLRLRLVNKTFATEVVTVLAQFKLLDNAFHSMHGPPPIYIATTYLERRILNERPGGAPRLLRVRGVAKQLSQETEDGRDEREYIRQLCPLVLGGDRWRTNHAWIYNTIETSTIGFCTKYGCWSKLWCDKHPFDHDLNDDVFVAALYTQTLPVVARWISGGKRGMELSISSHIFGCSEHHAAMHGYQDVLAAMMDIYNVHSFQPERAYILEKVAAFGHVDLTRFVWDFQAEQHPWACERKGRPSYLRSNARAVARLNTPSREIFEWFAEKRRFYLPGKTFGETAFTEFLYESARMGWVDMTAHYLALGALADGKCIPNCACHSDRPLVKAIMSGHKEVVKLLIDHGAHTRQPALETAVKYGHIDIFHLLLELGAETGGALVAAVSKGYRSIIDVLLERGGHTKEELQSLVPRAIEIEDKAIFQTLARHVEVDDLTRAACAKVAEENGLASMTELL